MNLHCRPKKFTFDISYLILNFYIIKVCKVWIYMKKKVTQDLKNLKYIYIYNKENDVGPSVWI